MSKALEKVIERLQTELEAAEERANDADQELENIKEQLEDGRNTWAQPQAWAENGLPLPRLEMCWTRDNDYDTRCKYMLVFRHLLDGVPDPKIVAHPLGLTRSSGRKSFVYDDELDMPFRDGAHAKSDSRQLKLPLYITDEEGNADQILLVVDDPEWSECQWEQSAVLRNGKRVKK